MRDELPVGWDTYKEMTERPTTLGLVQLQVTCQEQGLVVFLLRKVM